MVKKTLLIVGIIVLLMGILAVVPGLAWGTEPMWHAVLKIVVGAVATWIALKY